MTETHVERSEAYLARVRAKAEETAALINAGNVTAETIAKAILEFSNQEEKRIAEENYRALEQDRIPKLFHLEADMIFEAFNVSDAAAKVALHFMKIAAEFEDMPLSVPDLLEHQGNLSLRPIQTNVPTDAKS